MMKRGLFSLFMICLIVFQGCKDNFADLNTDPGKISEPAIAHLFTEALARMDPDTYVSWFYNNSRYYLRWSQAMVSPGGNSGTLNMMGDFAPQEERLLISKLQIEEIRYRLNDVYEKEEAARFEYVRVMCNPILVYLGMYGTDMYGSMAYSDAAKAAFTSPAIITPKYENQQTLFDVWLDELDETCRVLTNPVIRNGVEYPQALLGAQDFVYGGDPDKWARFANSLKLKIAVRMLHSDRERALEIAKEAANNSAGLMAGLEDDFIYKLGSQQYRFNDPVEGLGAGNNLLIRLLVEKRDPRLRFLFAKNDFNSSVVQAFFDNDKKVPSYVLEQVDYSVNENGKRVFDAWKSPGEPWVRYIGAPLDIQAAKDPTLFDLYFNQNNFKLDVPGGGQRVYQPFALYNEEMVRGNNIYTFPSPPKAAIVLDNVSHPWNGALFSTAELCFYMAEMKLLGAGLPESAEAYYSRGVELSVKLYDHLAALNKIPYYERNEAGFDAHDQTIALKEEEIAPLQEKYRLKGSNAEKLEQVYLQQYIHLLYFPNDLFVMVRRTGFPLKGSTLLPWQDFDTKNLFYIIPRRLSVKSLNPSDQMYKIKQAAFLEQGFTQGSDNPKVLNSERVFYDKNAPEFGEGNY